MKRKLYRITMISCHTAVYCFLMLAAAMNLTTRWLCLLCCFVLFVCMVTTQSALLKALWD